MAETVLMRNFGREDSHTLTAYRASGGDEVNERVEEEREEVRDRLRDRLRGILER